MMTKNGIQNSIAFTGKERDSETGYGYFGARYMDHELITMWLSVDPLSGKYPSISPYAYCAWNPIKLVDPDGKDTIKIHIDKGAIEKIASDVTIVLIIIGMENLLIHIQLKKTNARSEQDRLIMKILTKR